MVSIILQENSHISIDPIRNSIECDVLMAISALWMASTPINSATATTRRIALAFWTPTSLFGDPANFSSAHGASQPVTAFSFHDNDLRMFVNPQSNSVN